MKIRLDNWLALNFSPPPAITTARLWIKQGKIFPTPVKIGRSYYLEESATFQSGQRPTLANRIPK